MDRCHPTHGGKADDSQIKRNGSALQYEEILVMIITKRTEQGYVQQRSENPEVNQSHKAH